MPKFTKKRLGDLLVESNKITQEQLSEALEEQKRSGKKLGEILIKKEYVTKSSLIEVLESQIGISYINLATLNVESDIVHMIPEAMARKYDLVPIRIEHDTLDIATSDPLNYLAYDDVRIYTGKEVQPFFADADQINNLITRHFGSKKALQAMEEFSRLSGSQTKNAEALSGDASGAKEANESPAVKLINIFLEQATQSGASDIHIEPQEKKVKVRFRIDGILQDIMEFDIDILSSLVTRIKVMGGLNIAEKRIPQDGRVTFKSSTGNVDLRISILPALFGEKVVIRLINKETFNLSKEKLGFLPHNMNLFNKILKNPHGIILVTGPTGSGKSTTLYTAIKELNNSSINILTVEDPVESSIEGITQVAVNVKAGLTFAGALRSILRQDPDIILLGEIRDSETAEIAVRAAITGHLVLSTLHTNDAVSSVVRLIDMGIQPYLVSTSLKGVIAQRLVRRICSNCKTSYKPTDEEIEQLGISQAGNVVLHKGEGCQVCKGTGYKGRIAVHEVVAINTQLKTAIYNGESADTLKEIAIKNGMMTLRENCKILALEGQTTYEEMLRISCAEE